MSLLNDVIKNYRVIDLSYLMAMIDDGGACTGYGHVITSSHELGNPFTAYMLLMREHCYTHCDAPLHTQFGKRSIDEVPLESFMGPCCTIDMTDLPDNHAVSSGEIKAWEEKNREIMDGDIVLFDFGRPRHYTKKIYKDYPGLSGEATDYLVEKGVKLIGSDTGSTDTHSHTPMYPDQQVPPEGWVPAHKSALSRNVILVEALVNLDKLPPTGAYFIGFPLKIKGGSGSPIRAIALVKKELR